MISKKDIKEQQVQADFEKSVSVVLQSIIRMYSTVRGIKGYEYYNGTLYHNGHELSELHVTKAELNALAKAIEIVQARTS